MVNSQSFDYDHISRTFFADISDLAAPLTSRVFEQIYPDACDLGITMVSHKTATEAKFVVQQEDRDGEGDLLAWTLVPTAETLRKLPHLEGVQVKIFND